MKTRVDQSELSKYYYRAEIRIDDNDPLSIAFQVCQFLDLEHFPVIWEPPIIKVHWRDVRLAEIDEFNASFQEAVRLAKDREQYTGKTYKEPSEGKCDCFLDW